MDSGPKPTNQNPRLGANPLSQLLFSWLLPTIWKASKQGYGPSDQSNALPWDMADKLGDTLEKNWRHELFLARKLQRKPKLAKALFKSFYRSFIFDGLLQFLYITLRSLIPVLLGLLIFHFDPESTTTSEDAFYIALTMIAMNLAAIFLQHHSEIRQRYVGMRIRVACSSLIYRKIHRLSRAASSQVPVGQIINLLSNDVGRYDLGFLMVNYLWISPLQVGLVCYLTYKKIGYAGLIGIAAMILQIIPLQTIVVKMSKGIRSKTALKTDERIRVMNELITGIQVIKMYAWEKPFAMVVSAARSLEMRLIRHATYLRGTSLCFMMITEKFTLFITLVAHVLLGQQISADIVFSLAQFYNALQLTIAIYVPWGLIQVSEAMVTTRRIEELLLLPDKDDEEKFFINGEAIISDILEKRKSFQPIDYKSDKHAGFIIELKNACACWTSENLTLKNICLRLKPGTLCAIIGPVGSGKSSLLQLLIGELSSITGECFVGGDVAYASQEPWLYNGTIRTNILFGLPYVKERYDQVVRVCSLERDFQLFPNNDQTLVGDQGTSLSGGQKARVNLARCMYRQADIYVLDDPLSAVDAHVGKHLFNECIAYEGVIGRKTRIIATHQLHFLKNVDWIVIMSNGQIENQGTYAQLTQSKLDFANLLTASVGEETVPERKELQHPQTSLLTAKKRISTVTRLSAIEIPNDAIETVFDDEEQAKGATNKIVYWKYFRAGAGPCGLIVLVFSFFIAQFTGSLTDYWSNFWTQQETAKRLYDKGESSNPALIETLDTMYVYAGLLLTFILLIGLRTLYFSNVCSRSSQRLHDTMFTNILCSTMRFFDINPSGRILNRFSKDMGIMDDQLPKTIAESTQIFLVFLAILVMVAVMNPILLVPMVLVCLLYYVCIRLYLKSALDIRRTEGVSRSPLYSHVSATYTGIATIRSTQVSEELIKEFDILQDVHTACWQLSIAAQGLLGVTLDCISVSFVAIVTFSFLILEYYGVKSIGGNVGLAISQSLILTGMVQYGLRQFTEALNQMTSVERILEYCNLEQEQSPNKMPSTEWPVNGRIEFRNSSLRYIPDEPPVLKDLTFVIEGGWKVGIVGRTGAGKSSLISALFRLYPLEGAILIDNLETGRISLQLLRSKISIIPQDPILFSATLRYNLDPFSQFEDAAIWRALEDVELKNSVESLDMMLSEGGNNFSIGQRQLICLARAILRDTKILLLDEATANVDPHTDALVQQTIRSKFQKCTVLTIAHRLNTVMDSDRILVMDAGRPKEFGAPYDLLQLSTGALTAMVKETGERNTVLLRKVARESYVSKGYEVDEEKSMIETNGNIVIEVEFSSNGLNVNNITRNGHGLINDGYNDDENTKM